MGEGGMWAAIEWFFFLCVIGAGLIPLVIVALVPPLRRFLLAWIVALGIFAYALVEVAIQTRVSAGPGGTVDQIYAAGILFALAPLVLLVHRGLAKNRLQWPLTAIPIVIVLPIGIHGMAFRDRSERLLVAVQHGNRDEAARLLHEGADTDYGEVGLRSVDVAVRARDWEMVAMLIDAKAVSIEYHGFDDTNQEGQETSAAKRLVKAGRKDLADRLLANGR